MNPSSRANARYYRWGNASDGWHLLERDDLSVIEERVPPGGAETRHRHHNARQFFYALVGEATLEIEGVVHTLTPGAGIHVPPGAAHQLRNEGTVDACFLVISAPRSHGDREDAPA